MKKLRVIICEVDKAPRVEEINDDLKTMQEIVGGYIEVARTGNLIMVCDEDGKLKGLPMNRPLFNMRDEIYDVVCGDCFLVGDDGEDFRSLTDDEIKEWMHTYTIFG